MAPQDLALVQMEQLHLAVPASKSMSASNRTAPQWQLPLYVCFISSFSLGIKATAVAVQTNA